jgi:hypothetical protein
LNYHSDYTAEILLSSPTMELPGVDKFFVQLDSFALKSKNSNHEFKFDQNISDTSKLADLQNSDYGLPQNSNLNEKEIIPENETEFLSIFSYFNKLSSRTLQNPNPNLKQQKSHQEIRTEFIESPIPNFHQKPRSNFSDVSLYLQGTPFILQHQKELQNQSNLPKIYLILNQPKIFTHAPSILPNFKKPTQTEL